MHIACEGHPQIDSVSKGIEFVQVRPAILPEPVLAAQSDADGMGASIYGSVIRDRGLFRMWYQAWPRDWDGADAVTVACVESDDGLTWRRPSYGLIECCGTKQNHLTDLPFHCPSVFIDPTAPADKRYRAFGYGHPDRLKGRFPHTINRWGYFTAYSGDGIKWTLESSEPTWEGGDVITSTWNAYRNCALVALKRPFRCRGIDRRSVFLAEWSADRVEEAVSALVPDEYDDVVAQSRGFNSADYYGLGLMPTPGPTVGFLWHFRHSLPLTQSRSFGVFGVVDVSLVYQVDHRGRWVHFPGRAEWMSTRDAPQWARGGIYTAAYAIDVGDETWLYFTGAAHRHGWYLDASWKRRPELLALRDKTGFCKIGVAKWPRNRLMGYHAPLREAITLSPRDERTGDSRFVLNAATQPDGVIRVALLAKAGREPIEGYTLDDCEPISGNHAEVEVRWKGQSGLPGAEKLAAEIEITKGTLYAFEFVRVQ